MNPKIRQFDPQEWPEQAARMIQDSINAVLLVRGRCSVMLTGGRTAEKVFAIWAEIPSLRQLKGVSFYFGDERSVAPHHLESNYGMAMRTLFNQGVPIDCSVFRMEADDEDHKAAALRYEQILPDKVDVLLLGVGEDGHIASLFPGSAAVREYTRRVLFITGPKPPYERLTITPQVITQAVAIFVLAAGPVKAHVLANALQNAEDFDTMPARLALKNATWLLDSPFHEN